MRDMEQQIKFVYIDDADMVAKMMSGHNGALHYVFYDHYDSLLRYNAAKAAGRKGVEVDDLIQELYLYLSADDWARLRRYDPQHPFAAWFSVVSFRFFKDISRSMMDLDSQVPISTIDDHSPLLAGGTNISTLIMDIKNTLKNFKPPRDRDILEAILLRDEEPADIACRYNITVDNLYNIKRRALERFRKMFLK